MTKNDTGSLINHLFYKVFGLTFKQKSFISPLLRLLQPRLCSTASLALKDRSTIQN